MIGRNDVTGTRDVKITQFPRSPWRSAVAFSKSERRQTPARVGSFLFLSFFFFFFLRSFSFLFLPHSGFCFKYNTDVLITAYKRRLQICFRGGSAAGEQQAPPQVAHRSRRWRTRREGRKRRRKQGSACFEREREREREREKRI